MGRSLRVRKKTTLHATSKLSDGKRYRHPPSSRLRQPTHAEQRQRFVRARSSRNPRQTSSLFSPAPCTSKIQTSPFHNAHTSGTSSASETEMPPRPPTPHPQSSSRTSHDGPETKTPHSLGRDESQRLVAEGARRAEELFDLEGHRRRLVPCCPGVEGASPFSFLYTLVEF